MPSISVPIRAPRYKTKFHTILDPKDWTEVHGTAWADAQPNDGSIVHYVQAKSDSGSDTFSLATDEGPFGGNALKVTSTATASSTNATWSGTPPTVVVSLDGSPDLSGVTAGVNTLKIWNSTGSTATQYAITAVDNGAKTVTIATTPAGDQGRLWWITPSSGLTSFWTMRAHSGTRNRISGASKYYANDTGESGWNAIDMWIKFPAGFREERADNLPADYPNHNNWNLGTYHAKPETSDFESDNFHFYYHTWLRHDLYNNGWRRLRFGDVPTHQRSIGQAYGKDPTAKYGTFWDTATRLYWECVSYFDNPEIVYPFDVLVGPVALVKLPIKYKMKMTWDVIKEGQSYYQAPSSVVDYPFTVKNFGSVDIEGNFDARGHSTYAPAVYLDGSPVSNPVTLSANSTRNGFLRCTVSSSPQSNAHVAVLFAPLAEYVDTGDSSTGNPNKIDPIVESRWNSMASHDSERFGVGFKLYTT